MWNLDKSFLVASSLAAALATPFGEGQNISSVSKRMLRKTLSVSSSLESLQEAENLREPIRPWNSNTDVALTPNCRKVKCGLADEVQSSSASNKSVPVSNDTLDQVISAFTDPNFADSYVVQDFRPVAPNRWLFWIVNRGTNQSTPLLRYRDYGKGQRPSATPTMQRIDEDLDVSNTWKVFYIVSPRLFALCMRAGFWSYRNAFEDIFTKPPQAAIRRVNDVTFNADGLDGRTGYLREHLLTSVGDDVSSIEEPDWSIMTREEAEAVCYYMAKERDSWTDALQNFKENLDDDFQGDEDEDDSKEVESFEDQHLHRVADDRNSTQKRPESRWSQPIHRRIVREEALALGQTKGGKSQDISRRGWADSSPHMSMGLPQSALESDQDINVENDQASTIGSDESSSSGSGRRSRSSTEECQGPMGGTEDDKGFNGLNLGRCLYAWAEQFQSEVFDHLLEALENPDTKFKLPEEGDWIEQKLE